MVFQNLLLGLSVRRNFNYKTARYDSMPIAWRNIKRFTKRAGVAKANFSDNIYQLCTKLSRISCEQTTDLYV